MDKCLSKFFQVGHEDTAKAVGSGTLEVLASPRLIAWMENVSLDLCQDYLKEGETTVGIKMDMDHLAASPIGSRVKVCGNLEEQNKSRLQLSFEAYDESGKCLARANHQRAIVDGQRFMQAFSGQK